MAESRIDLPQGTLDLIILRTLAPVVARLDQGSMGASENKLRAKYYDLTRRGRKQLEKQEELWHKLTALVAQVLANT